MAGLVNGFPDILALFGALKLGTRLRQKQNDKDFNNYYLVGNLVSVLFAIIYAWAFRLIWSAC